MTEEVIREARLTTDQLHPIAQVFQSRFNDSLAAIAARCKPAIVKPDFIMYHGQGLGADGRPEEDPHNFVAAKKLSRGAMLLVTIGRVTEDGSRCIGRQALVGVNLEAGPDAKVEPKIKATVQFNSWDREMPPIAGKLDWVYLHPEEKPLFDVPSGIQYTEDLFPELESFGVSWGIARAESTVSPITA